jgi:hypothetical protein
LDKLESQSVQVNDLKSKYVNEVKMAVDYRATWKEINNAEQSLGKRKKKQFCKIWQLKESIKNKNHIILLKKI